MHFARTGADDDDRRVARHVACAAADLQTVDTRQHEVEDQRVPAAFFQLCDPQIAVTGVGYFKPFIAGAGSATQRYPRHLPRSKSFLAYPSRPASALKG